MRVQVAAGSLSLLLSLACSRSPEEITSSSNGQIIEGMAARGTGGGVPFDGTVDQESDLEDLLETARGDGALGLHRGHAPIEGVLEAFLGISHADMHVLMEQSALNLAGICERFGFDPDHLVETLVSSFGPFIEEAVENGVITPDEAPTWKERIRAEFRARVYWEG